MSASARSPGEERRIISANELRVLDSTFWRDDSG
jgi:hypothetical protein